MALLNSFAFDQLVMTVATSVKIVVDPQSPPSAFAMIAEC
jgi:hypothetical protein